MMEQKPEKIRSKNMHIDKGITVQQIAYLDNMNYPIRQQMEDSYFCNDDIYKDGKTGFFGVLDGHGGAEVVQYVTENIADVFKQVDNNQGKNYYETFKLVLEKLDKQLTLVGAADQGTCCCLALVRQEGMSSKCYIANLGDTRAVLCENGQAKRVSVDHKASNQSEIDRIKKAGGIVIRNRVSGQLAVTRALGDLDLKNEGVITTPDIKEFTIGQQTQYLIMASDGLWDVCEDQKAVDLIKNTKNPKEQCKILLDFAMQNNSRDNISIMILQFN